MTQVEVGVPVEAPAGGRGRVAALFSFPDPVNEVAARVVAGGVALMTATALVFGQRVTWLLVVLAYGFVARVLTGPTMSPLGQLATRVVTPRLRLAPRLVPGVPKRFAQGIGVAFSGTALGLMGSGDQLAARVVLGMLLAAAVLESVFADCLGCRVFAMLMRVGVVPASVCERCTNLASTPTV